MLFASFLLLTATTAFLSTPVIAQSKCTTPQRLAGAELVVSAYNLIPANASAASFAHLPVEDDCHINIYPDGGPGIPVAVSSDTTIAFADATRQLFSKVTGAYTDYENGTTIIHTNVTLGLLDSAIPIPVTFYADVYLGYNLDECLIYDIQAFATIPTEVLGITIEPPILPQILACSPLYTGIGAPSSRT